MSPDERPPVHLYDGSEKWAGGIWFCGRWRLRGAAPTGAARVEVRGASAVYSACCDEGWWEIELSADEQAQTVAVAAIAPDGRVIARDECIIAAPARPRGPLAWLRGRLARHSRAHGRGSVTYGPGSVGYDD